MILTLCLSFQFYSHCYVIPFTLCWLCFTFGLPTSFYFTIFPAVILFLLLLQLFLAYGLELSLWNYLCGFLNQFISLYSYSLFVFVVLLRFLGSLRNASFVQKYLFICCVSHCFFAWLPGRYLPLLSVCDLFPVLLFVSPLIPSAPIPWDTGEETFGFLHFLGKLYSFSFYFTFLIVCKSIFSFWLSLLSLCSVYCGCKGPYSSSLMGLLSGKRCSDFPLSISKLCISCFD